MDIWALIAGLAVIIGIVAGIVQVLDYLQKQREKKREPTREEALVPSAPAPAVPSNLPPRGEFIGREKEKARVREALASRWPLTCIDGIGKTALALEAAHESLRASKGEVPADGIPTFDGFIWTTAKDRELTLNDILDAIARILDYPGIAQQPLEEKHESVRKLLQSKRYLLIVDNFETVTDDAVRDFLLRLPEPSKALITGREQKLRQAWAVSLKGLEREEALTLIRSEGRRLGLASVEKAEEQVLLRLYQATGGAPLAIKWAVGQIKQKGQSLDTVLAALYEAKGDIFEEVFARSWSLLSDDARRILMVTPIFAASASRAAIEAASDVHHFALDEGLGQLVKMWLVETADALEEAEMRYSIHPLTRSFANRQLIGSPAFERDARQRTADYFLALAERYGGKDWEDPSGYRTLEAERANIFATINWYYDTGQWKAVIELVEAMKDFLYVYGYWDDYIDQSKEALEAARHMKNTAFEARSLKDIGWILCYQDEYEEARSVLESALHIAESINDKRRIADILGRLGQVPHREGNHEEARCLQEKSLEIALEIGDQRQIAIDHYWLGVIAYDQGRYEEAREFLEQALRKEEEIGWRRAMGYTLTCLGDVASREGRYDDAGKLYEEALSVLEGFHDRHNVADTKYSKAVLQEKLGNLSEALALALEAYEAFVRLGAKKESDETRALLARLEGKLSAD